ncbi:LCP family protein [Microlunatus speluncae]|uniref:LCP family protein n=1 Tax=Microlunatus speluncae TaxID=2594267 RepID=UPI001FE8CE8B|nr:LCP family protein [Microlunatus speluncae]
MDWLYGRGRKPESEPEQTRAINPFGDETDPGRLPATPPGPVRPVPAPPPPGQRPGAGPGRPGGPGGPGGPGRPGGPGGSGRPKKRRTGRIVAGVIVGIVVLLLAGLIAGPVYAWNQIERVDNEPAGERPAEQPGTAILLVGSDSREGLTPEEQKRLGTGDTAGKRTDTIMILYTPPSGKSALISVPRDSYVTVPGEGKHKINSAYAWGGAKLLTETVEQATGLRMDGYLEVGFGGFVDVIDSVGGIEMCIPKDIKDKKSKLNVKKGCQQLDGPTALAYVRMRYKDPRGDLGRMERQREMISAVAEKAAGPGTFLNPVRYWSLLTAASGAVSLGKETTFPETVSAALAMRSLTGTGGITLTVPISDPNRSTPAGSAMIWDKDKAKALFADLAKGDTSNLDQYVTK